MIKTIILVVLGAPFLLGFYVPSMSFSMDADSDNVDLNFERDNKQEIVIDKKEVKMYYDAKPSKKMHFFQAWDYCQKMNYQGYTNWRVPTKVELKGLLELSRPRVKVKHAFENVNRELYWTSTEEQFETSWFVDFDLGRYSTAKQTNRYSVMCVRDLQR